MDLLLRKVKINSQDSNWHNQIIDIRIVAGIIEEMATDLQHIEGERTVEGRGYSVSIGWMDIGVRCNEPGLEHRETLVSLAQAASAGGYTEIAILPNTSPPLQSGSEIDYIQAKTASFPVKFHVIGAVSADLAGKNLAELLDMHAAGAIAFSDGKSPIKDPGLLLRALQYTSGIDTLIINAPFESTISSQGQMHEGIQSTMMGVKGIPNLAETMAIERDLAVLQYSGGKLHILNISCAESVALIRQAKKKGLAVTASVAAMNLAFCADTLEGFDTNYKVFPPLREESDRQALIKGVLDGTIDAINSNHEPLEEEHKKLEFTFAKFGVINLETAFSMCRSFVTEIPLDKLVEIFSHGSRRTIGLPIPRLEIGSVANITIFEPETKWIYSKDQIISQSRNSPLIGQELTGIVAGIISANQIDPVIGSW